ncbi:TonB-dependent receptor [Pararoseomonas indoligenes]|uniref:TonB-dependent receptor n=1 Tax=Roseomonas indoligenes TaxID=2820811 RepID=A0A940N548_9PROT|nr:TonB-dependent receptor [Pararoseomonas indoligenes]MBP0494332.1 TonB-dependent receptor [Pararoseomonas indoligenes]
MTISHRAALLATVAGLAWIGTGKVAPAQEAAPAAVPSTATAPVSIPSVSVTASPIDTDQLGSFLPVTTLDQQQITAGPARNLGDVLFTEPGITASTFAPGASRPIIRGLEGVRVRLQENGFLSGDVSTLGEDHVVPLDPLSAERIEVVRGPASLRWGSQAIGGVVNVINNRIPTTLPDRAVQGRVSGGWNSGTRGWDGVGTTDVRVGNWVAHFDAFGRYDSDYRIPGGRRQENSGVRTDGKSAGLSYIFDQGFIGTSVSHFRSLYEIPGGEEAEARTAIRAEQLRWSSRGEYRPGSGPIQRISGWLGFTTYHHEEIGAEHDHDHDHDHGEEEIDPAGGRVVHGGFRNRSWDARLELQHVPISTGIGPLNGTFGFSFEQERLRTIGEFLEFLPPARTNRYAGYLFEELTLTPRVRLQAAGRAEFARITGSTASFPGDNLPIDPDAELENTGRWRSYTPFSVSLGALYDLPWAVQARVTGQYVQRAPSAAELFSRGAHDASGTFDIGDPGLRKERAATAELGLARTAGSFRFDTSAFYSHFDDFIFRSLTGNSCGEEFGSCAAGTGGEFLQTAYGQRDARFYGVEAKAERDLFQLWDGTVGVSGRYDFVRAQFEGGGGNLPRIPPHRLGGGVFWRDGSAQGSVDYLHAFDQNRVGENETPTKGYELLNARIGYTARLDDLRSANFSLVGTNLLDSDIRNVASFKKDEVLLPGRTVRLLMTVSF